MNLLELRTQFVRLSGHHELVTDISSFADNGANFYIRAGQDFIDRKMNFWKRSAVNYAELGIGEWYTTFKRCRVIETVHVNNTTGRSQLEKKDILWLYQEFASTIAETDNGTPAYYCPTNLRAINTVDKDSLGSFFNYVDESSNDYRGVIILPAPDEAVVVELYGQFYSTELLNNTDYSFWSVNHPDVLLLAALYQLEILYHRNTQGANDYLVQLERALSDIDKDTVEESIQGVTEFEE